MLGVFGMIGLMLVVAIAADIRVFGALVCLGKKIASRFG